MQKLLLVFFFSLPIPVLANSPVNEYMLDNGLKLLVKEDHRAPVVVSQVWYKVGGSSEHNGITGVSHVLEHMMFKGTEKVKPGDFSKIIKQNGGRDNAFTGKDYTAYFQRLHKDRLEVSMRLEADRMQNLSLRQEDFVKEVNVVKEERRLRTEDKPTSLTYEQFMATAFQSSPYHHPIIGWMDDLDNMELDDLQAWYERWYSPSNATLVIIGDVKADHVYRMAKKHFGPIPGSVVKPLKPQRETKQRGERRIKVRAQAEVPYLLMGYKVPVLSTAKDSQDVYALEVMAGILDGGNSARLAKELVRGTQIAVSAGAGYNMYDRINNLFLFDGRPSTGNSVDALEKSFREQVSRLQTTLATQSELDRIKAQVVAAKVYELDSVFYQGMQIGTLETVGLNHKQLDEYVARVRAVTPEQVQQVAKKYLIEDGLTVAILDPIKDKKEAKPLAAEKGVENAK